MSDFVHHMDAVAIRKSGIEGWEPFKWERVGDDAMVTGGIPHILKTGPRKGKKTWRGKGTSVVVTRAEQEAQATRYVEETGNCHECYGKGEVFASWHHIDGTKYKPCRDCGASGRAQRTNNNKAD